MVADQMVSELGHGRRMRVLVIEGNPAERKLVGDALSQYYTVLFAGGVGEALAMLRTDDPDVVVTELDLADGDGLAFCEHLRALPEAAHLPIMVLTSRADIRDKVAGFQAGADDYVVKPLDSRLFYARVRLLCRIKGLERPR